MQIVLPAAEGVNPAVLIDCGGASLPDVLGYCSRSLGWSRVLLSLGEQDGGRGIMANIGDLLAEQIEAASLEMVVEAIPKGATIRRIIIGNGVLATVSQPDGTILDNAIEAVNDVENPPLSLSPGFYDIDEEEDEDWDDEDLEEGEDEELEDEDEEDEEEESDAEDQAKTAAID
jgi:hypothetical protein